MSPSARWYRRLLRWWPSRVKPEYRDDMVATFEAMFAEARASGAPLARLRVWLRVLSDLVVAALMAPRSPTAVPSPGPSAKMNARLQDLRFALRVIARQPLFALVVVATIAIGISGSATIYSIANGLLFTAPRGVHDSGQLVTAHRIADDGSGFHAFGLPLYRQLAGAEAGLDGLAAYSTFGGSLVVDGVSSFLAGSLVSANYFDLLGTRPALGRFFHPDEDSVPGRDAVVVIGHELWRDRFDSDPQIVGREVVVNGRSFVVVGVAEEGFNGHLAAFVNQAWIPLAAQALVRGTAELSEAEATIGLETIGRLAEGVPRATAAEALDRIGATFHADVEETWHGVDLLEYAPIVPAARGALTAFLVAMFVAAGVLLAITSVNVANLLLSRGAQRGREIGVRLALGASRGRVVTQLLTETFVLFVAGGALGTLATVWTTRLLGATELPIPVAIDLHFAPDWRVLAFALAVAGVTGLVFGLSPALHATRGNLTGALKEGSDRPGRRFRLRRALVIAQVAFTAVLLVAAGLLVRSMGRITSLDLGLDTSDVYAYSIDTTSANRSPEESRAFYAELLELASEMPGVRSVGAIDVPPLTGSNQQARIFLPERPEVPGDGIRRVEFATVSPGYLETMRIPIRSGRALGSDTRAGSELVVVVNRHLAEAFWPGEEPLGRQIVFTLDGERTPARVVGVMADSKIRTPGDDPRPLVMGSWEQFGGRRYTLVARLTTDSVAPAIRDLVHDLDPVLPPADPIAYEELVSLSMLPARYAGILASTFGVAGLLLAALGLYGLLGYSVAQRSREIGVRMALGAPRDQVRRMVVSDGLRMTAWGLVAGLLMAAGLAQTIRWMLFDISPLDPITFTGIALLLLAIAGLACWLPARRAAATDPANALRGE